MGFLRSRVFSLKGLAPKEDCPVASKAVSRCFKLERYTLEAYLSRAVDQQGAEPKLGQFSILRLVSADVGHHERALRQGRVAGGARSGIVNVPPL